MTISVQNLSTENVVQVYSGKANRCCCGCAGKHTVNPRFAEAITQKDGYAPTNVSEIAVKNVIRKIQQNSIIADDLGDCISVEIGSRVYIAYGVGNRGL